MAKQKSLIFKLPEDLYEQIRKVAFDSKVSMAQVCRNSIKNDIGRQNNGFSY